MMVRVPKLERENVTVFRARPKPYADDIYLVVLTVISCDISSIDFYKNGETLSEADRLPIPSGWSLVKPDRSKVTPHRDAFFIYWFESYELCFEDEPVLSIENEREQTIICKNGCKRLK